VVPNNQYLALLNKKLKSKILAFYYWKQVITLSCNNEYSHDEEYSILPLYEIFLVSTYKKSSFYKK